jgi:signal transduction histidine kinase
MSKRDEMPLNSLEKHSIEPNVGSTGELGYETTDTVTDNKHQNEIIEKLERKLDKQTRKLSVLQYLAEIFTAMPKPAKLANMLFDLFSREHGANPNLVWIKDHSTMAYQPYFDIAVKKSMLDQWRLSSPNPFPQVPMILSQPQWFDKQTVLSIMDPLIEPQDNLEFFYIPFEYQLNLMGFAIIGIAADYPIEDELDALAIFRHQVAVSLFNSYLLKDLGEQRDVMKHKSNELEKANNALVNADRFKRDFLAITSHELRTPLTGMLGFTKLILDGLYEDEDEMRQMLMDSYSSGKYLLKLLNDILDMAKIESGMFQVSLETVGLQEIFSEVKLVVNGLSKMPNVVVNMPDNLKGLPKITADPGRLRQVLINLVSNALKFTNEGSVSVAVEHGIGVINFSVIDTGIGISSEDQKHIFEKFVQADGGYARGYGGTGLGLSICKYLLEMMNSTITLHSDGAGCGTVIRFAVPIA